MRLWVKRGEKLNEKETEEKDCTARRYAIRDRWISPCGNGPYDLSELTRVMLEMDVKTPDQWASSIADSIREENECTKE